MLIKNEENTNVRRCFLNQCVVLLFNMDLHLIQALSLFLYGKPHYYRAD